MLTKDEGYVYVVGYSNKFTQSTSSANNPVVAKFQASDGATVWSAGIGGNAQGEFNSVDIPDDDSYVYCSGTTQIWTATASTDSGVLIQISATGSLQWVRSYSDGSNAVQFNSVVVLNDHSSIYTFGNKAATSGIIVKWDSSGNDALALNLPNIKNLKAADLFIDNSIIIFAGENSASKLYVGGLRLSDSSFILDKNFNVASTSASDISVNINGIMAIAGAVSSDGMIVNFDTELNDVCTALDIQSQSTSATSSSTSVATTQSSQTLHTIFPTVVSDTFNSTSTTTTLTSNTCGEV